MPKPIATNKKAYHKYFLSDKWECGVALTGGEVKSVRAGEVNFKDSFVRIEKEEAFLYSLYIAPYAQASYLNEDPDRPRKLLLHKKQIGKIVSAVQAQALTVVPTKIYINKRGLVKIEIALAKGKKLYDKREDIKRKSMDRAIKRTLKNRAR